MSELTMTSEAYNQMALEQVDRSGLKTNEECPDCGMQATRRDFEACHSGSVNQHYSLDCSHCGYHECDQDVCMVCESKLTTPVGYDESSDVDLMVSTLLKSMRYKSRINPVEWSLLKLYAVKNPEAIQWYFTIISMQSKSTISEFFYQIKRELLDVKFEMKLNKKIEDAALSCEACPECHELSVSVTVHQSDENDEVYVCVVEKTCSNCGYTNYS